MMYAIIRTAGFQYRAEPGKTIRIPSLDADEGSTITFDEVLLGSDGSTIQAGTPLVEGARVTAEVVRHGRGKKLVIFKHKRRKNYRRKQGHRQGFTEVRINDISLG
jgi:large subunit ribosomal protein L21